MVPLSRPDRLTLPVALTGAAIAGGLAAGFFLLIPTALLEDLVVGSGVPGLVNAAAPPLGMTARLVLALGAGGALAAIAWAALFLLLGERAVRIVLSRRHAADGVPVLRRADAHPDAPARRPLRAGEDLGVPFLDVNAAEGRPLPGDLATPLAAYDPTSIPDEPREPVRAVPALVARPVPLGPGERLDSIELPRAAEGDGPASIESLLSRLERSARARRSALAADRSSHHGSDESRGLPLGMAVEI